MTANNNLRAGASHYHYYNILMLGACDSKGLQSTSYIIRNCLLFVGQQWKAVQYFMDGAEKN